MGHATEPFFLKKIEEKTVNLLCPPPTNLALTDLTATSVKLKWDAQNDALGGYQVQIRIAGTTIWLALPASTNFLIVQNLLPATTYQWQVKSICDPGGDGGDFSDMLNFTTLQRLELRQTGRSFNDEHFLKFRSVELEPRCRGGFIRSPIEVGERPELDKLPGECAAFYCPNLAAFTVYKWRVRAICSNTSVSDWSVEKEFKTLEQAATCPKPEGLAAINITQNSAKLTWAAVAGALFVSD